MLGEGQIFGDGERDGEPLGLAIFAEKAHALARCVRGGERTPGHPEHLQAAAPHRIEAEDAAQKLGAPRSDQPGDAEHLAAPQGERDAASASPHRPSPSPPKRLRPGARGERGKSRSTARPTIIPTISAGVTSARAPVPTVLPSRKTVKSSAMR